MSQLLTLFFSAESNRRWNYTVQPVAMEPSQAKHEIDRNTPTYMCYGSLLISVSVFIIFLNPSFPLRTHSCTAHIKGRNPMCVLLFPLLQCVEEKNTFSSGKAQIPFAPREDCLTAPCWMSGFLRGRERKREREKAALKSPCALAVVHCWLHCLLPGGHKLIIIIHMLSHQRSHTHCNPDSSCAFALQCKFM